MLSTMYSLVIVGNYFYNKKQISEELCVKKDEVENTCQGKCHLAKQLKNAEPKTQNNPKSLPELISYFNYVAIVSNIQIINFEVFEKNIQNNFYYTHRAYNKHLSSVFRPPIA